ncbi:MAG: hypothetical protein ABI867_02850 [Kofleriaceae bacterium]
MRWFVGLVAVLAVVVFVMAGGADWEAPLTCPVCGLDEVVSIYRGPVGGPTHHVCRMCMHEFRRHDGGPLVSV